MNDQPELRTADYARRKLTLARVESHKEIEVFKQAVRSERTMYFFLGWCAGVLTLIAALLFARTAGADCELPAPDPTIEQIKVPRI